MRSRAAIGYVVEVDGVEVTLNLLDMHRGHLAAHGQGVSTVTDIGSLLAVDAGSRLLIMKVLSLTFAEPKEAHRASGRALPSNEPLRHIRGLIVGRLSKQKGQFDFVSDSLSTPPLGAEVFPLVDQELAAVLGSHRALDAPIHLGDDLRGGVPLMVGLEELISRHVAVLGSSGQGKTCFTAAILQQIVQFPGARIVVFDINGEYEDAFDAATLPPAAIKVTRLGGEGPDSLRLPYYALGRQGLQRLLIPSEKTQRPALTFAIEHLDKVRWFGDQHGVGLADDANATLFDDCRADGAPIAADRMKRLRENNAPSADAWPPMAALSALIAESHALAPARGTTERNAFNYGNVAPLITRVSRFVEDPMFSAVVDVEGGPGAGGPLSWRRESKALVEKVFGGAEVEWRVHIIDLRRVAHDLTPFVLGALLELYAYELFNRGQENKIPTMLVLEEAHHYLRPTGSGDEAIASSLAYERLAKEGRKFGLALWLSTQRPSEVSPTVLSQCNNWISFRLTSEKDLAAVQAASEWADKREVRRIAGLPRQTAVAFGGSLQMPALMRASAANPLPRSQDAAFDQWNMPTD
ncbi:hypothetical protein HDE76_000036 [Rhodanobacter sp. ANJX3]|uniref:anti-phage-associated helicase HerA n=1 Tax=Rhodanobacter sp. ANJX3 TaxID=2723083 RepID=UPI0016089880|nr:anti-phage-associated helicase HerA [Rhodanobacter sp. ANJX3]MBB5356854.1 hypothetical protein [Rhodanobacter sp. ANJX3]